MARKRHKGKRVTDRPSFRYVGDGEGQREMWVKLPLGEWEAQVRLEPQDGQPVIAELRIVPWGPWDAEEAPPVPAGGLTARQVRSLKLGSAISAAYKELRRGFARDVDKRSPRSPNRFDAKALAEPRQPGRRGRSDSFYAHTAQLYVDALAMGSRQPVKVAAQELSEAMGGAYTDIYVRDLLSEARRRELLTRPARGRAGGELTDKGRRALEDERRS